MFRFFLVSKHWICLAFSAKKKLFDYLDYQCARKFEEKKRRATYLPTIKIWVGIHQALKLL